MPTPDELADALYDRQKPGFRMGEAVLLVRAELRTLAREAAKGALLSFIHEMESHAGAENADWVRAAVERWPDGEAHGYSTAVDELVELAQDRAEQIGKDT